MPSTGKIRTKRYSVGPVLDNIDKRFKKPGEKIRERAVY